MSSNKKYNTPEHNSRELSYMYGKICNIEEGVIINNRYKILNYLGKGGFGVVYKCFDNVLNTNVAIKFLNPIITRDPKKFHRIKREINISRMITDKRIVKIYSLEKYYDVIFLVMEFIDGITLSEIIKKKIYKWEEFKPIFLEILRGISLLHKNEIIHRDMKPGNIMILKDNSIKIVDFGLAKEISDTAVTSATEEFVGTAEFVSPEQVEGIGLDSRSDIYQIGLILYKVLSGKHPFASSSTMELLVKYLTVKPRKINQFNKSLPGYVEFLVQKMLESNKKDRFSSVDEIIEIIEKESVSFSIKISLITRKKKFKLFLSFILILLTILISYLFTYGSHKIDKVYNKKNVLYVKNKFNKTIWKKNVSPYSVIDTFITPLTEINKVPVKDKSVFCLLESNKEGKLSPDESIDSTHADDRVVIFNKDGNEIINKSFNNFFNLDSYGYVKMFKIREKPYKYDFNKDGFDDYVFSVGNSLGMYPYGFIYIKNSKPIVFTYPGILKYNIFDFDKKHISLTFSGINNLFSGLSVFFELKLKDKSIHGIPNVLFDSNEIFDTYTYFLPSNVILLDDKWEENGFVVFTDNKTSDRFILDKSYKIKIIKHNVEKTIQDPLRKLKNFNILFNSFYKEYFKYNNYVKAEKLINNLIDLDFENPYLNSALYFYKGDLLVTRGMYKKGETALKRGYEYYPENSRIAGLLCEIPFLKGSPLDSIKLQDKLFADTVDFSGLQNGSNLFKIFMYLSAGMQTKAEKYIAKVIKDSSYMKYSLMTLLSFYNGKLKKAEQLIEEGLKIRRGEISNVEFRLLCSKIYILNNSNLKRAEFFLKDILKYSQKYDHLSELSLAYLLAKKGKKLEAEKMAIEGLKIVEYNAKGDFSTKVWLFYEYFIYAKTMEIVGNKKMALQGFKSCIKCVPNSYLAKLSRKSLTNL